MARIKIAYIGGGGTRAVGTNASFIHQGANFAGSEIVLIDKDRTRLPMVHKLATKMASEQGADLRFTIADDLESGLTDCDAVLTSYRPGCFQARHIDESIPLKYNVIGNETQGPGGFFMALRSINDIKTICRVMKKRAKKDAIMFNYTNPVNIVSQAVSMYTDVRVVSFCEGPIVFPKALCWWHADEFGLDANKLDANMIGLNHAGWTTKHLYDGKDFIKVLEDVYEQRLRRGDPARDLRILKLTIAMNSIPAHYYDKYFFEDEMLTELKAAPFTRAQEIMRAMPDYWKHYTEQALTTEKSVLDPGRSRGGIHELELAIDAMDAVYNDRNEIMPVNIPNMMRNPKLMVLPQLRPGMQVISGGTRVIPDFEEKLVVEVPALVNKSGFRPIAQPWGMPKQTLGLVHRLGEYQYLTAKAAWTGNRQEGIQALCSNPLVRSLEKSEKMYDEMARALRKLLPRRLLRG